jgi:hypothetical protein
MVLIEVVHDLVQSCQEEKIENFGSRQRTGRSDKVGDMGTYDDKMAREVLDHSLFRLRGVLDGLPDVSRMCTEMLSDQDLQEIKLNLARIEQILNMAYPDMECQFCAGLGCRSCGGSGWTSRHREFLVPKELL